MRKRRTEGTDHDKQHTNNVYECLTMQCTHNNKNEIFAYTRKTEHFTGKTAKFKLKSEHGKMKMLEICRIWKLYTIHISMEPKKASFNFYDFLSQRVLGFRL